MAAVKYISMETNTFVDKYNFAWMIHNLSDQHNKIVSASFVPLSNMETQFRVSLDFFKLYEYCDEYTSTSWGCYIILKKLTAYDGDLDQLKVKADLEFTKIDGSVQKEITKKNYPLIFRNDEILLGSLSETFQNNDTRMQVFFNEDKTPSDDTLIVKIHFEFLGHKVLTKSTSTFPKKTPQQKLAILFSDFSNLYESQVLTDITIRIKDNVFQAHQVVLAARSPVFKRMLENSFMESGSKCVTITDIDSDIFSCFLKYLYSGVLEDKTYTTARCLYSVADKYEVSSLQEDCAEILVSNLNAENICCVLELSYLHNDKSLKDIVVAFISAFFNEIKPKPEWNELIKKYPELTSEVLGSIVAGWKI